MQTRILSFVSVFVVLASRGASGQYNPGVPRFYPPRPPTQQGLPQLARSLAAEAQQAADNLRYELSGTYLGRQSEMRANALAQAASSFQQQVDLGGGPRLLQTFTSVDRAYAALAEVLRNSGGMAPRTSNSMERIQRLSFQVRNVIGSYDSGRPGCRRTLGRVTTREVWPMRPATFKSRRSKRTGLWLPIRPQHFSRRSFPPRTSPTRIASSKECKARQCARKNSGKCASSFV